ncbi:hypothetical protein [Streptomyces mirabilis]|uniref:hypothetical protein n=1 Tax=Streptomyces mirabilis TaxID=68239 RepID=UPI0036DE4C9F
MSRAAVPAVPAVPAVAAVLGGGDVDGGLVHVGSDSARLPEIGDMDYAAAKLSLPAPSASRDYLMNPDDRAESMDVRRGTTFYP